MSAEVLLDQQKQVAKGVWGTKRRIDADLGYWKSQLEMRAASLKIALAPFATLKYQTELLTHDYVALEILSTLSSHQLPLDSFVRGANVVSDIIRGNFDDLRAYSQNLSHVVLTGGYNFHNMSPKSAPFKTAAPTSYNTEAAWVDKARNNWRKMYDAYLKEAREQLIVGVKIRDALQMYNSFQEYNMSQAIDYNDVPTFSDVNFFDKVYVSFFKFMEMYEAQFVSFIFAGQIVALLEDSQNKINTAYENALSDIQNTLKNFGPGAPSFFEIKHEIEGDILPPPQMMPPVPSLPPLAPVQAPVAVPPPAPPMPPVADLPVQNFAPVEASPTLEEVAVVSSPMVAGQKKGSMLPVVLAAAAAAYFMMK